MAASAFTKLGPQVIILDLQKEGNPIIHKPVFKARPTVVQKRRVSDEEGLHTSEQVVNAVIEK